MSTKVKHRSLSGHLYLRARPGALHLVRVRDSDPQNAYLMRIGTFPLAGESTQFKFHPHPMPVAAGSLFSMSLKEIEMEERDNFMLRPGRDISILPEMIPGEIHPNNRLGFALRTDIARHIDSEGGIDICKSYERYTGVICQTARLYSVRPAFARMCYETYLFYGRHDYALINDIQDDDELPEEFYQSRIQNTSISFCKFDTRGPQELEIRKRKWRDFIGSPTLKGRVERIQQQMSDDLAKHIGLMNVTPRQKNIRHPIYKDLGPQGDSRLERNVRINEIMSLARVDELVSRQKLCKDKKR